MISFIKDSRGNVAVVTALGITALVGIVGGTLALTDSERQRRAMQESLDTATLAATVMPFTAKDSERIALAHKVFDENYSGEGTMRTPDAVEFQTLGDLAPEFRVTETGVEGTATVSVKNGLVSVLGVKAFNVEVKSRAERAKSSPVCLLALETESPNGIEVYGNARLEADKCAVMVNSADPGGMRTYGNDSFLSAEEFGVTGGFQGENYSPLPNGGVRPIEDPFEDLEYPQPGPCINQGRVNSSTVTLSPGTYCGGLTLGAGSDVHLNPGVYIIKDGQFAVGSQTELTGDNVVIFLMGADSYLWFKSDAHIKLTSPVSGPYQNLQMASDNDLSQSKFETEWTTIMSGATFEFDGTVYLPEQEFWMSGTGHEAVVRGYSPVLHWL